MNKIFYGDSRTVLKNVNFKARTCVTSPPYFGVRNYGDKPNQIGIEKTVDEYIDNLVEVFSLVKDCLTDDGTLWVNIGDNYEKKNLLGIPFQLAFALKKNGWYLRQDIIWHKPNPMPESVTDRCTKSHEYIFLLSKSKDYYFNSDAIKEKAVGERWGKNKPMDINNSKDKTNQFNGLSRARQMLFETRNKRSVWTVKTKPYKESHFAVFPKELITPCILSGSEHGDIVLDPFIGSGTTAETAKNLGRKYIGVELNEEYKNIVDKRSDLFQYDLDLKYG